MLVVVSFADHRYLLLSGALAGALLVLAADTAGRTLFSPAVIPAGIVGLLGPTAAASPPCSERPAGS